MPVSPGGIAEAVACRQGSRRGVRGRPGGGRSEQAGGDGGMCRLAVKQPPLQQVLPPLPAPAVPAVPAVPTVLAVPATLTNVFVAQL